MLLTPGGNATVGHPGVLTSFPNRAAKPGSVTVPTGNGAVDVPGFDTDEERTLEKVFCGAESALVFPLAPRQIPTGLGAWFCEFPL